MRIQIPEEWVEAVRRRPVRTTGAAALGAATVLTTMEAAYDLSIGAPVVAGMSAGAALVAGVGAAVVRRRSPLAPDAVEEGPVAPGVRGTQLPRQARHLLGRTRELARLMELVDEAPLVTVVGPGGTGKTALAVAGAHGLAISFEARRFVDLQALQAGTTEIADVVSRALSLPEAPDAERLAALVGDSAVLLVLDNCEHVLPAVRALARVLLDRCPKLRLLATSRQPLGLGLEQVLPLDPLEVPEVDSGPAVALGSSAVQLFLEQARRRDPALVVDDDELAVVVRICRWLDGLPLGIVVAAARVGRQTLAEIESALGHCLDWTTPDETGRGDQQRTLGATVEWSHSLLSPEGRILFRRISVFAGSFHAEGARALHPEGEGLAGALDELVEQSLLDTEPGAGPGTRYRMLEVVRGVAAHHLEASGERDLVRDQHLRHVTELAEHAAPALTSVRRLEWLTRLREVSDEFPVALAWARQRPAAAPDGQRLAGSLLWFWNFSGRFLEGRGWLESAVAWGPAGTAEHARALYGLGVMSFMQGVPGAHESLEKAAAGFRALPQDAGVRRELALVLTVLAIVRLHRVGHVEAVQAARESVSLFEELGEHWGRALALNDLGRVLYGAGQVEESDDILETSLNIWRGLGDDWGIALVQTTRANTTCERGDTAGARARIEEALALQVRHDDAWGQANSHFVLAAVAQHEGDLERARDAFAESVRRNLVLGRFASASAGLVRLADLMRRMGDLDASSVLLGGCDALQDRTGAGVLREQDVRRELAEALPGRLGADRFASLHARGCSLEPEALLALAHGVRPVAAASG